MGILTKSRRIIKESLLKLDSTVFFNQECLGCVVAPVLFQKGKRALLIDDEKKSAIVFAVNQNEANNSIMLLTELIAYVKVIKRNGLVLDVDTKHSDLEFFYSIPNNELFAQSVPGFFETGDGCILEYSDTCQIKDDGVILTGYSIPTQLFSALKDTLLSVSFPTPEYSDYLNHNFNTIESFHTKRALKISWFAIAVAILIGVLSPLFSVFIGNRFGYTVLKTEQFQELIQIIRDND